MVENSNIEWCDHTFNPWVGCTKISAACDNCYAEAHDRRFYQGQHWGPHAARRRTSAANWKKPLAWLLLTKRPQNIKKMLPNNWGEGWSNVWLGTTAENQIEFDRRAEALAIVPAAVRFISAEPLLEEIEVGNVLDPPPANSPYGAIHWVICGGESGPGARPMHPEWARSLRDQCKAAGAPFHFKQWGDWLPDDGTGGLDTLDRFLASPVQILADGEPVYCVGKKRAGRLLDGVEHNGFPEVAHD